MTTLRWGAVTDVGRVRSANQDSYFAEQYLFAVADGMGGHAAGEVASSVAIEVFANKTVSGIEELVDLVKAANQAVIERGDASPELAGMGTTLCAIALVSSQHSQEPDRIVIANVGDSRVYLLHDGALTQITVDHSFVEDLVREGRLTPQEARRHPKRNVLTRVLGNEHDLEVDSWDVLCRQGDRFLLCSDGLFNELDNDQIASVLRRLALPDEAARELLRLANEAGGRDNITVLIVDVEDDGNAASIASGALAEEDSQLSSELSQYSSMPSPEQGGADEQRAPGKTKRAAGHLWLRRPTWRTSLFLLALFGLLGATFYTITWFADSSYYVGVDKGKVTIFRGRPEGVLWIDPKIEERTDLELGDVPLARRDAISAGKQVADLEAARDYIKNIEELIESQHPTTTTTTTTTTTLPVNPLTPSPPVT